MSENGPSFSEIRLEVAGQEPAKENENIRTPHCLFISGAKGTNAGMRGIKEGLENQYGIGRVEAFNSVLSSEDPKNPERFEQMADFIQSHAREGLDIVAYSLGAAELKKAIDIVKKRDGTFFDNKENTQKLHIILISPSGFLKGIDGPFRFLSRTVRFVREEADIGSFSKPNTLLRGIDALTAFPPDGINQEDLTLALREAMPELSQYQENQEDFSAATIPSKEDFAFHLTDDKKKEIDTYSASMRLAIENRNYSGLRELVKAYGEKLRGPLVQVFAGSFDNEEKLIREETRTSMLSSIGGYIGLLDVLINGFGGKTMDEIADLSQKGVKVDLVIPEYDTFMKLKDAVSFFNGLSTDASSGVHLAQGITHLFPALKPTGFAKMISDLGKNG